MGIVDKIYSSIKSGGLFKIISKHGVKWQFGPTPGFGWQDVTFTIKPLIHRRHNHKLSTWVVFADLVKAFDTSNHALLVAILGKYGAPPRICSAIKRMYNKSMSNIIISKVETSIDLKVGVKQGDSTISVLFMFLMMAFAKALEVNLTSMRLSKAQFSRKDNSPRSTRQLASHRRGTFSSGMLFDIFYMLYVEDGYFLKIQDQNRERDHPLFRSLCSVWPQNAHWHRKKLEDWMRIFLPSGFFNTRTPLLTHLANFTLSLQKKEINKKRRTCEDKEYTKWR